MEEDKFDIFDIPLTDDTQNNDDGGDPSSHEQVNTGFPIGAAKKDSSIDDKNISKEAPRRLLHCKIHLNDQGTPALIDTGAAVSIIIYNICQRYIFPIDITKKELLCGFNQSVTRTHGVTELHVQIGDHIFQHAFHVIPFGSQKAIIGNDTLIEQDAVIYPGREYIEINQKSHSLL